MIEWIADKLLPPAIVAVIFSYLTNMFIESHRAQRDALTDQVSSLRDDLIELWELASAYWGRDFQKLDELDAQRILLLEQDIRFRAMEIAQRLPSLGVDKMKSYLADLADEYTGGDFDSPDKKIDRVRLVRMRKVTVQLRDALLTARDTNLKDTLRRGH